jgi:hypothetical protein
MYDELLEKVKRIKPSALDDADILDFFKEAVVLCCGDGSQYSGEEYIDHVLMYYALAHISLYSGDLAEYSNYFTLYNQAMLEYRRHAYSNKNSADSNKNSAEGKPGQYQNMW